ncbi:hypothetical protein D3C75_777750 [compost metagenome]
MRLTPARLAASSSLALPSIHLVTSLSAGPPLGGLYLKPPLCGGLCDGVMTMPSARPCWRPRLWQRMAWETAGVGVYSSSLDSITCTPLAASTSRALAVAGADSAWVSAPMNSGPSMPFSWRYRQMAWVMARTWYSLKLNSSEVPRCPEVPKATRWAATAASGRPV